MACQVINEQEILKMYQEGEKNTITKLAKKYGVSRQRIGRLLKRNGLEIRHVRHMTNQEHLDICKKYFEQNIGPYTLSREYQYNYSTIRKILIKDERYAGHRIKLEQEEKEDIIRKYMTEEITHTELANEFGRSRSWISRIINDTDFNDPKYPRKKKTFAERKKTPKRRLRVSAKVLIEELKTPGVTQRSLADKYQVSESCIYHAIARYQGREK